MYIYTLYTRCNTAPPPCLSLGITRPGKKQHSPNEHASAHRRTYIYTVCKRKEKNEV